MTNEMTKGELTRREIVKKAAPLFNRKGFEGTSLSDLMRATGLQKGGIYRHFTSKQQLAGEAFDYAWEKAVTGRLEGVNDVPNSIHRLKKMIDNFVEKREGLVPGGCPLMNTAVESDDGNALLRARARKALESWTVRLAKIAAEGVASREISARIKPLDLAQLIISSLEGALLLSRLQNSSAPLRNMQFHLHHHLDNHVRS
ncbi:MAG TPA: TetR/AcrR family transcriptional regulator [Candidatus Acidoferrum sp.]|nr:TetR/AcrR family transcriptional regulator [Candidatus Acidoferrum sp.]